MVCSPHRYIVSGIAAGGINYTSDAQGIPYKRPVYSNRYQEPPYETKKQTAFDYAQTRVPEKTEETKTTYVYTLSFPAEQTPFDTVPAILPQPTYTPLRPIPENNTQSTEAPMTNQNIKQTKQKLAQLIMNELDSLGPREEHTHEHGEHTHVH